MYKKLLTFVIFSLVLINMSTIVFSQDDDGITRLVAYTIRINDETDIYIANIDGSDERAITTVGDGKNSSAISYSPDGQSLLFVTTNNNLSQIDRQSDIYEADIYVFFDFSDYSSEITSAILKKLRFKHYKTIIKQSYQN